MYDKKPRPALIDDSLRRRRRRQSVSLPRTRPKQVPKLVGHNACDLTKAMQPCVGRTASHPGANRPKAITLDKVDKPEHPVWLQLHRIRSWARPRRPIIAMEPNPIDPSITSGTFHGASAAELDADKPTVVLAKVKPFVQLAAIEKNPLWRRRFQMAQPESEDLARKEKLIRL